MKKKEAGSVKYTVNEHGGNRTGKYCVKFVKRAVLRYRQRLIIEQNPEENDLLYL